MSSDREAMYALFEKSPGDLTAYGAMADALDDDGWTSLAHAFRWMCRRGVYPHNRQRYANGRSPQLLAPTRVVSARHRWAWYRRPFYAGDTFVPGVWPRADRTKHSLPALLLHGEQTVRATHQECVMFLAHQLTTLAEVYRAELPGPKGLPLYDVLDTGGMRVPPPVPDATCDLPGGGMMAVFVERADQTEGS